MSEKSHGPFYFVTHKVVPAIILLTVGIGCLAGLVLSRSPAATKDASDAIPSVTVTTSAHYEGPIFVEANGLVVPHREIIMAAQVRGSILVKGELCQSGRWVPKDTELLRIDDRDYVLTVSRLKAELKQAETQIKELDAEIQNADALVILVGKDLDLQKREYNRLERLRDSVSMSELDQAGMKVNQAENAFLTQKHQLNLLKTRQARLEAAKELASLQLEQAELDLSRTVIKAPSDGVIVMEEVEEGTYVTQGNRLLVFEDTTHAEIEFNLTVDELYWIMQDKRTLGLPSGAQGGSFFRLPPIDNVSVEFEVEGAQLKWLGKLDGFASYGVNEQTRNVPCRVIVDKPYVELNQGLGTLRRGMFVRVKIPVEPSARMLRFPESALTAANKVWVVRDDKLQSLGVKVAGRMTEEQLQNFYPSLPVSSAFQTPSSAQIESQMYWVIAVEDQEGLQVGLDVVDSPLTLPYDGMQVIIESPDQQRPVNEPPPAAQANTAS